jgi:hypothetical protein
VAPYGERSAERDIQVVEAMHHDRLLKHRQAERLFFAPTDGRATNTNRARERLRLLYQHGYPGAHCPAHLPGPAERRADLPWSA